MNNKTNKSAAGKATSGKSSSGKSFSGKRSEGRPAAGKPSEGKTAADAPKAPEGAVSRPLFIQATQALSAVLAFDFPADAVLSRHFRDNRELGHRDRGFIAEAVYGVLRRLRWLRRLAGDEATPRRVSGNSKSAAAAKAVALATEVGASPKDETCKPGWPEGRGLCVDVEDGVAGSSQVNIRIGPIQRIIKVSVRIAKQSGHALTNSVAVLHRMIRRFAPLQASIARNPNH